jgi:hypothetical protein
MLGHLVKPCLAVDARDVVPDLVVRFGGTEQSLQMIEVLVVALIMPLRRYVRLISDHVQIPFGGSLYRAVPNTSASVHILWSGCCGLGANDGKIK